MKDSIQDSRIEHKPHSLGYEVPSFIGLERTMGSLLQYSIVSADVAYFSDLDLEYLSLVESHASLAQSYTAIAEFPWSLCVDFSQHYCSIRGRWNTGKVPYGNDPTECFLLVGFLICRSRCPVYHYGLRFGAPISIPRCACRCDRLQPLRPNLLASHSVAARSERISRLWIFWRFAFVLEISGPSSPHNLSTQSRRKICLVAAICPSDTVDDLWLFSSLAVSGIWGDNINFEHDCLSFPQVSCSYCSALRRRHSRLWTTREAWSSAWMLPLWWYHSSLSLQDYLPGLFSSSSLVLMMVHTSPNTLFKIKGNDNIVLATLAFFLALALSSLYITCKSLNLIVSTLSLLT